MVKHLAIAVIPIHRYQYRALAVGRPQTALQASPLKSAEHDGMDHAEDAPDVSMVIGNSGNIGM